MLDLLLDTVYRQETAKTASAALTEKLRTMPMDVVEKLAFGPAPNCVGDSGDVKCWLDNFKGTPLFEKAVELERADLQLEQADIEQRMNNQAQDTWTKRDAIRLQKRMLELDLAMAGTSAGAAAPAGPEAEEEQGIALLEQAQAEEAAAGEGNKPEEQMENNAIAELHAAHGEGAPAEEKAPPKPPAAAEEGPPGPPGAQAKAPPKPPAKKEPPKEEAKPAEDEKQAATKVAAAVAAGRLLAKIAEPAPPKGMSVKEWDKVLQKKAAAGHSSFYGTPEEAEQQAAEADQTAAHEEAHPVKTRLKNMAGPAALGALTGAALGGAKGNMRHMGVAALTGGALGAGLGARWTPGEVPRAEANDIRAQLEPNLLQGEAAELHQTANDIDANPGKYRANRALAGGGLGAAAGAGLGNVVGHPGTGALLGGGLGAVLSALPKPVGKDHREAAQAIEQHLAKRKTAGINVGGLVGAAKAAVPQVAGALSAGKSMVGTAMKAGGLPQVAKSVGNVATGFAKANPLAAAGVAGAAGLAAGRLSKGNQPQRA